jgi:hypothetical protein
MQIAKIKMSNEKLKQIRQEKELEYGSFDANMNYIGKAWSALLGLETDIPGHMVANMYVAAKLIRTNQKFKQDTYDDAANYLYQAEEMQRTKEWFEQDANTRMHDALRSDHKTNYPKDEPELEPDEEELALARREAVDRLEEQNKAAAKAIYNVK